MTCGSGNRPEEDMVEDCKAFPAKEDIARSHEEGHTLNKRISFAAERKSTRIMRSQ
jgi:hypothetical protein